MGVITESMAERHTNETTYYHYYNLCLIPTEAIIAAAVHHTLDSKTIAAAATASLLEFTALATDIRLDMAMGMGVGD